MVLNRASIIKIEDDFDLDIIADSGQCFRWEKEDHATWRIIHREHILRISAEGSGYFHISCSAEEFRNIWRKYFDLDENYAAIRRKVTEKEDPFLFRACTFGKGIRILRQDPWEALISFIISQNRNIPAIRKSIDLLCDAAGGQRTDSEGTVYHVFPSPEGILSMSDEALTDCRLGYRASYVKAAALEVYEGRLDLLELQKAPTEQALKALMKVHGVGLKVASCAVLFGLHQLDAFPVDVWISRVLENEYPSGYPKEKYYPYNGVYQQYMFYYYKSVFNRTVRVG